MIISHKYKFIFIKTRKTAGSSIQMYLSELCGEDDIITPIDKPERKYRPRNYRGLFNPLPRLSEQLGEPRKMLLTAGRFLALKKFNSHIMARHVKKRIPADVWNSYYKFAVDRNPWDKVLSHYHYVRQRYDKYDEGISFNEYLRVAELPYNYMIYTDSANRLMIDRVIKYEELNEGLSDVFGILGVPFDGVLRVNEKSHYRKEKKNYREFYNDDQRDFVAERFSVEIGMHGYEF